MITIILIEPKSPGNLGAIARSMKNFALKDLTLINPKCNHLSLDALSRASHAKDILKKAKIKKLSYLNNFDYVIGTTAIIGTDYNLPRTPLTPEQLAEKINPNSKTAILFGRESSGLSNKEIEKCDFIVKIPVSAEYPTLNISHAASIIFYELFKKKHKNKIPPATKKDKEVILNYINKLLNKLTFQTKEKKLTQKIVWKRILNKAILTKREAFAVMGFFRKLLRR